MTTKERFEKHRREAVITCNEDCLCWDVEIMAAQIAALTDQLADAGKEIERLKAEVRDLHAELTD